VPARRSDGGWIPAHSPDVEVPARPLVRPALVELLDQPGVAVTLVCAPVGHGKSTLVRQWLERGDPAPCAWVPAGPHGTADEVAAAVGVVLEDLGRAVRSARWDPPPAPDGAIAGEWLRGMPASVLVVDGLRGPEALSGIEPLATAIAAASGCGLRLVATTRARPTDDLARLLARGAAALVSEDDLALDPEEAVELVSVVAGRSVDLTRVEPLLDEVGGWTAGLATIARAWQRATTATAMGQRTRSSLEVLDEFVIGEVLDPFDAEVRGLVAELGHLPVLAPDLCDQLLDRHDSAELLAIFRAGGGMVSPREGDGWVDVHPALRGAIRRRVHEGGAERRTGTDDAAVAWFLAQGEPIVAIHVLADAGRWDEVRTTTVDNIAALLRQGQVAEVAAVLRAAPLALFQANLFHVSQYAFFELATGNVNRALQLLKEMDRLFSPRERLGANLVRSTAGVYLADPRPAMLAGEAAFQALDDGMEEEMRSGARFYIGATGEMYRVMLSGHLLILGALTGEWRRVAPHRGEPSVEVLARIAPSALVGSFGNRATHLALAGELVEAEHLAARGLEVAIDGDLLVEAATASAGFARGEARRAGGDWQGAIAPLATAREQAGANHRILLGAIASASLAHAYLDGGDPTSADEVLRDVPVGQLDRARTVAGSLAAARARILMAEGDSMAAVAALRTARLTPMTASECVTIALQLQDFALAEAIVAQWPVEPTVDNRVRRGLALAALGTALGRSEGTEGFGRAVSLAAKHGLVQPVIRLAEPLAPLLRATARKGRGAAARLCQDALAVTPVTPLPGRQLAVIRLLEEGLTLSEIATELHISVSMVKKHTRAIYKALGATNRAEAVQAWTSGTGPTA
jgi:LuxR family maltose regulon positive regulatory protein